MSYPNPDHIDRPAPPPTRFLPRAMELCVLGSGSGGNCSLVKSPGGVLMIDAGIGPRTLAKRLGHASLAAGPVTLADLSAVCLTHLDSDHFKAGLFATLEKLDLPVWCHASRVQDVLRRLERENVLLDVKSFDEDEPFEPVPGLCVHAIPCPHDSAGSHAFRIEGFGRTGGTIGYATDLGAVPPALLERFCDLDVLAIESNYDRQMQIDSPRPAFLKHRIMSGRGHLSNAEAFAAVRELFDGCRAAGRHTPRHVVLLHRSDECNCPDIVRKLFGRDKRIAKSLVLSDQCEPTPWLRAGPGVGEQLTLVFG